MNDKNVYGAWVVAGGEMAVPAFKVMVRAETIELAMRYIAEEYPACTIESINKENVIIL